MKRKPMSYQNSKKVFRRTAKVHGKNNLPRSGTATIRGGIRL